jgi:DNA-binding transcriptional MerR regulator
MPEYNLSELAAATDLSPRTIRYYIAEGLVPSPGREGPATRYPDSTLARLRLIARLREAHQPLAEIRARLEGLTNEELAELVAAAAPVAPIHAVAEGSALDYVRSVLGGTGAIPTEGRRPERFLMARVTPTMGVAAGMSAPMRGPVAPAPAAPSQSAAAQAPERSQWERIALGNHIELHVRRPLGGRDNRMVERLIAFARQLQREELL